jgi:hypothetical protein
MFLTAVAHPRFDSNCNCTFDRKLACGQLSNQNLRKEQATTEQEEHYLQNLLL